MSLVEERLNSLANEAVTAAVWDPRLHPRARNGQFIRTGGWVRALFRIGGDKDMLNGQVVGLGVNSHKPHDPLVQVRTKHGILSTPASEVAEAAKPKAKITGLIDKLTGNDDRLNEYKARMGDLSGDVTFESAMSLKGMDLNGVPLSEVPDFDPRAVPDKDIGEPPLEETTKGLKQSTGVLIEEPDGRIWIYEPANHFGGYKATFSKGRVEDEDTPQQAAMREAYEELGLVTEITGYVGDYRGSVTMTRMYRGKRIGGAPWIHDKEVAEVRLVSPDTASAMLHTERDQEILSDFTGDPTYLEEWQKAHPKPPPKPEGWWKSKKAFDEKNAALIPAQHFVNPKLNLGGPPPPADLDDEDSFDEEWLDDILEDYRSQGVKIDVHLKSDGETLEVSRIVVPEDERNSGTGTMIMDELVTYADENGLTMVLTPSSDFGGTKSRLVDFYKRFGFVENKGKNKDFKYRDTMYRPPEG
jgi:8-oxo-dGTP pyrophosphatase MutT (NUDIX family)/GNAT superfamily N-acetyltransferase